MKTFARTFRAVLTNDLVRAKAQSVGIVIYMVSSPKRETSDFSPRNPPS